MKSPTLFIGMALAACGVTPLAAGQMPNLVVGGDFESVPQGSTGTACHSALLPSVPGWSSNRGFSVDRFENLPSCIDATINPFNPLGGAIALSLQGSVCCGCDNNGWIEQSIPTEAGKQYRISFEAALDHLDVLEVKAGTDEWTIYGTSAFTWSTFELEFIATGGTLLRFASLSPSSSTPSPGGGCWEGEGCLLDNIRVRESGDCDADGISDADEIAAGAADLNANGIPDTCECIADLTGNGEVNGADISVLLGFWGKVPEPLPSADINRDGLVDGLDLAVLLGSWGECP